MPHKHKLSLWSAILININVMFGTGIFINTVVLAQNAGLLGFLGYFLIALLAFPLVFSMAKLVERYPHGGFYAYGSKELSPFIGFLSSWSYFFGKLASGALMLHAFSMIIQQIIRPLSAIPTSVMDLIFIGLMTWANLFGIKTSKKITYAFVGLKVIPACFVTLAGIYLYNIWNFPPEVFVWEGIPATLPLVLFAFCGFEVACSISRSIENPEVNAPKAMIYSYLISVGLSSLYQLMFFLGTKGGLMHATDFLDAYPLLIQNLLPYGSVIAPHLLNVLHIAAAASALGGSYGIIFSNQWNLYELASHKHLYQAKKFLRFNSHHIPFLCVLAEALTYIGFLFGTGAQIVPLQQTASLGVSFTYLLGIISFLNMKNNAYAWVGWLSVISCMFFLTTTINSFMHQGFGAFFLFVALMIFGCIMFWTTPGKKTGVRTNES